MKCKFGHSWQAHTKSYGNSFSDGDKKKTTRTSRYGMKRNKRKPLHAPSVSFQRKKEKLN
jgi:hypothetical protein